MNLYFQFSDNNSVKSKHIHDMRWLVNDIHNVNIVHEQTKYLSYV